MTCSDHFVDGKPTLQNPSPTLNLGYEKPAKKPRITLTKEAINFCEDKSSIKNELSGRSEFPKSIDQDHDYLCKTAPCLSCIDRKKIISSLSKRVTELSISNSQLQEDNERQSKDVKVLQVKSKLRKPFSVAAVQ